MSSSSWSHDVRIFSPQDYQLDKAWPRQASGFDSPVELLISYLKQSKTGKKLLILAYKKAKTQNKTLLDVIKIGNSSLTDTTLIRKFSSHSLDKVDYRSESIVYVDGGLSLREAVLDLAHELNHFVYRGPFNPYLNVVRPIDHIKQTIESRGGEAYAFASECQVRRELFYEDFNQSLCSHAIADGKISLHKIILSFYALGAHFDKFKEELKADDRELAQLPLSDKTSYFISSAYGVPYPLAALREYHQVVSKVCENDKKRILYYQERKTGRSPSSMDNMISSYIKRCSDVENF